ncbi:MAG: hypothetical protein ACREEM_01150 [Blastocatellia bacterium]
MVERSAPNAKPHPRPAEERGFLSKTLGSLTQVLVWLVLSLVFLIAAEWIGMAFFWPAQGQGHNEAM